MKRFTKDSFKGQTVVEFTLLLPLIVVLVGGLTDAGLAFYVGTSMQNAVREGARLRAGGMLDVETEVKNRIAVHGRFTGGTAGIDVQQPLPAPESTTCPDQQTSVTVTASG